MAEQKSTPLALVMESARTKLIASFNEVAQESKLPAFLLEGMVEGLLAQVRASKIAELSAATAEVNKEKDDG